jgi:hypothetical protein
MGQKKKGKKEIERESLRVFLGLELFELLLLF